MSLPDDIIALLRDEAYLVLCRTALKGALERAIAEKEYVASTRPPFGIIGSKKTKETYEHSMRTVSDTAAGLENRVAKLDGIEVWLKSVLRDRLRDLRGHAVQMVLDGPGVAALLTPEARAVAASLRAQR